MQRIAVDNGQCTCVGRASRDIRTILGVSSRRDTESAYSVHRKSPRANVNLKIILFFLEISSDETLLCQIRDERTSRSKSNEERSVSFDDTLFLSLSYHDMKNSIASIIYYSQSTTVWSSSDVSAIHILKRIVFLPFFCSRRWSWFFLSLLVFECRTTFFDTEFQFVRIRNSNLRIFSYRIQSFETPIFYSKY